MQNMGQRKVMEDVSLQNVKAFAAERYDYIITLCASCGAHLKNVYPEILKGSELKFEFEQFSGRIKNGSSFTRDVPGLGEGDFKKTE